MKFNPKSILPHVVAVLLFIALSAAYFQPVLDGKKLRQYDNTTFQGTSKEIRDFREKFGDEPLWTNAVFGGMPAALISVKYYNNWMTHIERTFQLWLPHPMNIIFICMLGFYIMFLCLRVDPWLAMVGGIAFGFSTYNFLIIEAGHNTKAVAMAWMAPVIGAMVYTYRSKALWGAAILALFFAFELRANHLQVTYYLVIILVFYGIAEFVQFTLKGQLKKFLIRSLFVISAIGIGVLPNYSMLKTILSVADETTRGQSNLTIGPDGKPNAGDKTSGLNRSYIVDYSYGRTESFNLWVPNAVGTNEAIGNNESVIENIENPQVAQQVAKSASYWSDESNGGPNYLGATAITLFVISFLFITDLTIWAFFAAGVLALMLAWGKNSVGITYFLGAVTIPFAAWLLLKKKNIAGIITLVVGIICIYLGAKSPDMTNFFIDKVWGYNKFRAVTIILVVCQVVVPLLGIWGIHYLVKNHEEWKKRINHFYIAAALILLAGVTFTIVGSGSFDFLSAREKTMFADAVSQNVNNVQQMDFINQYKSELVGARSSIFMSDALRTLALMAGVLLFIFLFIRNIVSKYILYGALGLLILIDLWSVDIRYLNNDEGQNGGYISWVEPEQQSMPHYADAADYAIFETELRQQPQLAQSIAQLEETFRKNKEADLGESALTLQESDNIRFRELGFATNYRVLNLDNPFNDGRTCYFHKSIGGYTGAKQKRIQEIVEFHYQRELQSFNPAFQSNDLNKIRDAFKNAQVLGMMNAKYIILNPKGKGTIELRADTVIPPREQPGVIINGFAFGNGWFVKDIKTVANDNEEILGLGKNDLRTTAIMQQKMQENIGAKAGTGEGSIKMTSYRPNRMVYEIESKGQNLALFSEVFTKEGWTATIDGKETPIARANYLLRAIEVPDGKHTVEFKFDLPSYRNGEKISLVGSILIIALLLFAFYKTFFKDAGLSDENTVAPVNKPIENPNVID
ncbi:MAG TPA: YfhO family protein [Flavobacteriales bacterium]|nr:YfhO family protein [Flavobacteriales bacterium]